MADFDELSADLDMTQLAEKRRRHIRLMSCLGICAGGLYGYALTSLSGALVSMNIGSGHLGHLNASEQGMVTSSLLLCAALGSYLAGMFNDRFGPHHLILTGALLSIPGAALSALAPNLLLLILGRGIIGMGIGMTSTIVPIYLADMIGVRERGRLVSINSVMIVVWQLLAVSVNAVLNQLGAGWRSMLWTVMVPAVLLSLIALAIHDSPAHLVRHGLHTEAVRLLHTTHGGTEARDTYDSLVKENRQHQNSEGKPAKATFSTPWLRRILVIGIGLGMINQLTGLNIVNYYAPTIFVSTLGFDPSLSILTTVPVILVSALASVIGGLGLIDRFNRRTILAVGLGGTIVFLIGIGVSYLFIESPNGSKTAAWIMIAMMMVYVIFVQGLVSPVTWLLLAEIFPASIKSRGMGYSNVAMNLSNFALSLFFPILLNGLGGSGTYLLFAAINIGSLVFALAMVPETRGKSQMQIEQEARERG